MCVWIYMYVCMDLHVYMQYNLGKHLHTLFVDVVTFSVVCSVHDGYTHYIYSLYTFVTIYFQDSSLDVKGAQEIPKV